MKKNIIQIGDILVGEANPVFIIAEVGINHNGDIDQAKQLINAAKKAGANSVKLQSYLTEKRVSRDHPVYEILKKCELTNIEQKELFDYGKDIGILIFSTPFDDESVDFLESINCPLYKIASFDSVNHKLLRKVSATNKPIIMSTGMTSETELSKALGSLTVDNKNECNLALLHCISSYPMNDIDANLNVIKHLSEIHPGPIGYSDHSIGINVPILAIGAGASIIEKHFTLDTTQDGPDHAMSANPKILEDMITKIRWAEKVLGNNNLQMRSSEEGSSSFRRFKD